MSGNGELRRLVDGLGRSYANVIDRCEKNEKGISEINNQLEGIEKSIRNNGRPISDSHHWNGSERREDNVLTDKQRAEVERISDQRNEIRVGKTTLGIIVFVVGSLCIAAALAFFGIKR